MYTEIKKLHEYHVTMYQGEKLTLKITMDDSDTETWLTGKDAIDLISMCDKYINDKFKESKK